jgi:hypothetical protein
MIPILFLPLLTAAAAFGQTTFASITGTVSHATGAAIPGAQITATHTDSNYQYSAQSNAAGNYTLAQLREGAYVLRAQAPGFKEFVVQGLNLVSLDVRRIDIRMEIGAVETRIEVTGGATLIERKRRGSAIPRAPAR